MKLRPTPWLCCLLFACASSDEAADFIEAAHIAQELALCDGTGALKLRYSVTPGSLQPDSFVPWRSFFMLDGNCQLFANDDPWQPMRVTQLSASELVELAAALDLAAWPARAGSYFSGIGDGPTEDYWIDAESTHARLPTSRSDWSAPEQIRPRARAFLALAAKRGEEVQGAVRYTLVPSSSGIHGELSGAVAWPLGDVDAHLTRSGQTRVALAKHAAMLRLLRASYLRGELGSTRALFIPILQPDGRRYELRMRDVAPYQDESATDTAPPECADDLYEAQRRAVAEASASGCNSDADCMLTDKVVSCLGGCSIALPRAAFPAYQGAQVDEIGPLCSARADAGCQMPPIPDCASVEAGCREHVCVAVAVDD